MKRRGKLAALSCVVLIAACAAPALLGVRGQSIFVDPQTRLVMVHTAVRKQEAAGPGPRESTALWAAAVRELGGAR
jgi:hypothetical protein